MRLLHTWSCEMFLFPPRCPPSRNRNLWKLSSQMRLHHKGCPHFRKNWALLRASGTWNPLASTIRFAWG